MTRDRFSQRDMTVAVVTLIIGLIAGMFLAEPLGLTGTAREQDNKTSTGATSNDTRVLYQLDIDTVETWLLKDVDRESEEYAQLTAILEQMKNYGDEGNDFTSVFGSREEVGPVDSILTATYEKITGEALQNAEELEASNDKLAVIVGAWEDPYEFDGASLQFYLKVPKDMADKNLPQKEWEKFEVNKPLETTIFWTNLGGLPTLE